MAASAGGVEALTSVLSGLPADIPAAIFVVLHLAPLGPSVLPAIISRHSALPARHPVDGEAIISGQVYVAPPDFHLLLEDGRARVLSGPRINGNRPAADPLFRSVAEVYGKRAAGVVLSGALDDGSAGLGAIKDAGGETVVQDPEEAAFPGMPMSAIAAVDPARVAVLRDIPGILCRFAEEVRSATEDQRVNGQVGGDDTEAGDSDPPSEFTCPDCGGTLWFVGEQPLELRCRVGHSYSTASFDMGKKDNIEEALWAAIVALDERADLSRRLIRRIPSRSTRSVARHRDEIRRSEAGAATLRQLVAELVGPQALTDADVDGDVAEEMDVDGGH